MKRFHRKTRTGCMQCRKRHIKCDESRPSCMGCVRNHLQCSLNFLTPIKPEHRASCNQIKPNGPSLVGQSAILLATADVNLASTPFDMKSMELMHHFTSSACLGLGTVRNMRVFQIEIPRLALSHEFAMHGLCAVSALHLAYFQPERRSELIRYATSAEHKALPSFQNFVATNSPGSIHAVFAFAGFLPPYLLVQDRWLDAPMGRIPNLNDDRPHWFLVLRGLMGLLARSYVELAKGPFSPLLVRSIQPVDCTRNPDDKQLANIYSLLQPQPSSNPEEAQELLVCRTALDELRRVAALPFSPCRTLEARAVIYIWPGTISNAFMQLIHRRKPEALVILAHFCVYLKKLDWCWYFEGVGSAMLAAIEDELDEIWRPWIAWALEQPVETKEPWMMTAADRGMQLSLSN